MHPLGVLESDGKATEVIIDRDTRYGINAYDYFIYKIGRSPIPTEKVHFIVATDILIVGESPDKPAIHFDNRWTSNNRITLTNYGFILGRGGKAGKGARVDWRKVMLGNYSNSSDFIVENAEAGGNGGVGILNGVKNGTNLIKNGLKLKVINHKLISSGGGGGGGSGAWRTALQHSVPEQNRLVTKTGVVLNSSSINGSFGGGSSGSGGAPLGEWVPHNATIDNERKKYALGSREDRILVSMRNYELHRKWAYGIDTYSGVGSFSTDLSLYSTFNEARIDKKLHNYSMDEYNIMIGKMMKYTGGNNNDIHWDKPFQGYEVKVNNDNTASFRFLIDKVDPDLIAIHGKPLNTDIFVKNQTHPIYPEDREFFENIKMCNPYFNTFFRYTHGINTSNGSRIVPPDGGRKQSQLKAGSNFGLTTYYAPPAKTELINGGFTGVSTGEQYTIVNWHRNHSVEDENTSDLWSTVNFLFTGATGGVIITPFFIKASVLIIDGAGKVVPYLRERDYYKGGRGGYLGSDGEAGTLNKMYFFEDLQRNGNNYNIPTYLLDKTRIAPPAPGGKAGLITEGDVLIENTSTGIMRGYTSGSNKVEQPLTPNIISSLDKKFVKPVNRIVPFSHSFVPGFDPYDWECEIGMLPNNGLDGVPVKHHLATKKLGFETYVLTKNLALNTGITPTKPGEIRVVIPAGYMTYSHIPGVNEWVKKHNFSNQALQLATILTYLVETFKTLHLPLSINEVGVFHLISPQQIDDVLIYQNSISNAVSASALNELIALRTKYMSANNLSSLNLTGIPTRVVNGETQYLIAEYEVYASLRISNGAVTERTIKSTLISQTSIASSFSLPLFNGHNGDYVGRITLPRNIELELMPSNPSYVELIFKTGEYKYEIPNSIHGTGTRRVKYWAKSVMSVDHCLVDTEKQKLVRDAIEWYRQTGKWE